MLAEVTEEVKEEVREEAVEEDFEEVLEKDVEEVLEVLSVEDKLGQHPGRDNYLHSYTKRA